jgi:hypothetical protein
VYASSAAEEAEGQIRVLAQWRRGIGGKRRSVTIETKERNEKKSEGGNVDQIDFARSPKEGMRADDVVRPNGNATKEVREILGLRVSGVCCFLLVFGEMRRAQKTRR